MEGYRYLHAKLAEINEPDILALLRELEIVTGIGTQANTRSSLFHHLSECIYPNGGTKDVPITKVELDEHDPINAFLLRRKIKNLGDSEVYVVCQETARHFHQGLEPHDGKSLYIFINQFYSVLKKKKPAIGKRRWFI